MRTIKLLSVLLISIAFHAQAQLSNIGPAELLARVTKGERVLTCHALQQPLQFNVLKDPNGEGLIIQVVSKTDVVARSQAITTKIIGPDLQFFSASENVLTLSTFPSKIDPDLRYTNIYFPYTGQLIVGATDGGFFTSFHSICGLF